MKHYELEFEPLIELSGFRDSVIHELAKMTEKLNEKKTALFSKDISMWGYTFGSFDELMSKSNVLLNNKAEAFKYMLSAETQKL